MFFPFARLVNLEKSISDYYFCLLKKSIINQLVRTSCQVISMVSLCGLNALMQNSKVTFKFPLLKGSQEDGITN